MAREPTTRSLLLIAIVLVAAVAAAHVRIVVGGRTFGDLRYHAEVAPPRLAAAEAVRAGELPHWWDGTGLGVPLAAEPSHGAMYVPGWLASTPRALDLLLLLHLVWAGLGVAMWARRTGASDQAALVAGAIVATSGLLASTAMRGALPALAHLPWIALCARQILDARTRRSPRGAVAEALVRNKDDGATAGAIAEALARDDRGDRRGEARAVIALAVLIGLVGLAGVLGALLDAVAIAAAVGLRRATLRPFAVAVGAGLAIACVQWIPAVLAAGHGVGGSVDALPLGRLVEVLVPGAFGSSDGERAVAAIAGSAPWAPSLFVGATLCALACVRTPARPVIALIAGLGALALVAGRARALAWVGPAELHLAALALVLAGHAGAGLDALVAKDRRAWRALAVGAACTLVAMAALGVMRSRHPGSADAIERALIDGGLGLACVALVLGLAPRLQRKPERRHPDLLALLVLPTAASLGSTVPTAPRELVDEPPAWVTALEARVDPVRPPAPLPTARRAPRPPPADALPEASAATQRWRAPIRVFRPFYMAASPGEPEELADALATFAGASAARWNVVGARSSDPARSPSEDAAWQSSAREGGALLDRFGIAHAILPASVAMALSAPTLDKRGEWALVELPVAQPASVLRGWMWNAEDKEALELMYPAGGGTGILRGTTVLRGSGAAQADRGPPLPCTIARWRPGDIELACTSDARGYAVVSSAPAPGWSVTVDDHDEPWLTADVLRRAVAIDAGAHRVRWRYATPGLALGLALAGAALAGLVAAALVGRRRRDS